VLTHHFNWKRLSMSAAVGYAPDGSDAWLVYGIRPGSYNDESLIEFLEALHLELAGAKLTLIWDGLPSHRAEAMSAYVASQRSWLVVEATACLRPRPQSRRDDLGQPQIERTCKSLPGHDRRGRRGSRCRSRADRWRLRHSASPFCGTPDFLYDQCVTVLCEPL